MFKTTFKILLAGFLVLCTTNIFGQLISIGVGGGLTQVTGSEEYTDNGLGYSTEYNFGAIGKVDLPLVPITPRAFALYHKLTGDQTVNNAKVENSQSILSLGVGASYNFIPIPAGVDPYVSLDIMFNSYGDMKQGDSTRTGNSRTGIGIGVGAEVTILPKVNLDVSASYRMFNLIGKEDREKTLSAINLDVFFMFSLL